MTHPTPQQPISPKPAVWEFLRALLGNVTLLLLMVGAERLFFDQGYYATLIQHPFWIIVLIAAVQDGLFVGVLVAVAATVLMDWPPRPAEADITTHYIQIAIVPVQWLLAALCIGLFRQAELRRAKAAATEMARLEQVNEVLATDVVALESHLTRAQLETLSRDGMQGVDADLIQHILALQSADISTLAGLFSGLAELCTPSRAGILLTNTEGELEALDATGCVTPLQTDVAITGDQLQTLRRDLRVVVSRMVLFDEGVQDVATIFAAITSPDRRTLQGAVVLTLDERETVDGSAYMARFLASQLVPVLAHIRAPKIALVDAQPREKRVSRLFHG